MYRNYVNKKSKYIFTNKLIVQVSDLGTKCCFAILFFFCNQWMFAFVRFESLLRAITSALTCMHLKLILKLICILYREIERYRYIDI